MDSTTLLGFFGGILTTISFLPQVIKTWKTRSTSDVSLWMFLLLCIGIIIWIIYGFLINSLPVIFANLISFILTSIILVFKIRYK
ncbi:MAG: hypothetical protein A2X87_05260 [Deltaproteobacteria bacterium GWC2_42_51]|nr:MAG: hypothetical protein A2067_09090 [Deltaproteobacteria bacterium GWB2_42_7]OGP35050.1 MAG: hypothetical protein A2X87_05260 [Deltaproteobacteria bacterium GWC2_42_51]OGP43909.1 MAG: hypothetical protein A2090_02950 [Deltaproteobacteria bacterium GWD2_42_10]OGP46342.1 MAG: hypothetical protein A2022_11845 [Deltaproteobacteria bacterium GWF2_42_12]OGQ27824.1 MAG: hypothetical protein A3D29_03445 [Deltaproteobacteria bacterium RIFCSPHIGHO2_02_FULL_42_44]OGQ64740.1 MAG: hypothetical protein